MRASPVASSRLLDMPIELDKHLQLIVVNFACCMQFASDIDIYDIDIDILTGC